MADISLSLLGDIDPRTAVEQLHAWGGPVWIAESAQGADALVTAAGLRFAAPQRTVGFAVLVSALRHPWSVATACRTLAAWGGDVRLGIGVGDAAWKQQLGLETTRTVSALSGEIVRLRQSLDAPGPAWMDGGGRDDRRIPIYVGAEGPRMTAMAATSADGLILPFLRTDRYLRERVATLKAAAPRSRAVTEVVVGVADTAEAGAAKLQRWLRYITRAPLYRDVFVDAGLTPGEAERYRDRVAAGDADAALPLPIVQSICVLGTPEQCADNIARRHTRRARIRLELR